MNKNLSGIGKFHNSPKLINKIKSYPEQDIGYKPKGFWYSCQDEWLRWVRSEMPHWEGKYYYKVETDDSKILKSLIDFNGIVYSSFKSKNFTSLKKQYDIFKNNSQYNQELKYLNRIIFLVLFLFYKMFLCVCMAGWVSGCSISVCCLFIYY